MVGIDRVGRSLVDSVSFLETCRAAVVSLWIGQERLDTETDNGLSLFEVAGMPSHQLRQNRRERIPHGRAAARITSVKFGRPRRIDIKPGEVQRAKELLEAGVPVPRGVRMTRISPASIGRLKSTLEQPMATT